MFGLALGHTGKTVAIVDIGAGSVGTAIVRIRKGEPSLLVAASRSFLPSGTRTEDQLIMGLAGLLKDTGADLLKKYAAGAQNKYGAPRDVYCVVRAPWTQSQTLTTDQAFEKPTHITDAMIGDMAKKALASATADRTTLFEAHVARVELNGYPTKKPTGKTASSISVGVLSSTAHQSLKTRIDEALHATFPHLTAKWRSHTRAALTLLSVLPEHTRNCVVVDVSNEGMNILAIRKSLLDAHGTMAEGVRGILARIAPDKSEEETLALMKMLNRDACSGPACDQIAAAMGTAEPEIVRALGDSFAALTATRKLPATLILLAHADISDWLMRIFARIDFAPFTVTGQPFTVQTLGARDLGHWIIPDTDVIEDAALSLAGALVHIESDEE